MKTCAYPINPALTVCRGSNGKHQQRKRCELRRMLMAQAQHMQAWNLKHGRTHPWILPPALRSEASDDEQQRQLAASFRGLTQV